MLIGKPLLLIVHFKRLIYLCVSEWSTGPPSAPALGRINCWHMHHDIVSLIAMYCSCISGCFKCDHQTVCQHEVDVNSRVGQTFSKPSALSHYCKHKRQGDAYGNGVNLSSEINYTDVLLVLCWWYSGDVTLALLPMVRAGCEELLMPWPLSTSPLHSSPCCSGKMRW